MKIVKPNPPQELKLSMPYDGLAELRLYQEYQKTACETKWNLPEMAATILTVFLAEGDPDYLTWRKRRPGMAKTTQPNGVSPDA